MKTTMPITRHLCAVVLLVAAGCGTGCRDRPPVPAAVNEERVQSDVRGLLDRWMQAFESRDAAAVRSVLASDARFVWLEDGQARYQSVDDVLGALATFPPGMSFDNDINVVKIVPVSDAAAWAQLATKTEIRQGGQVLSTFAGVVLMLVQRDEHGWRIVAAHSSTNNPRR